MTTSDSIPQKCCIKCGEEKPATTEYFNSSRGRLRGNCKACRRAEHREYRQQENVRERRYRLYREWCKSHPDYQSQYLKTNVNKYRERTLIRNKAWKQKHAERVRQYSRDYHKKNPLAGRFNSQRRNARKRTLPSNLTVAQWQACLEYFHHTCAYCGAQQSFWHVLQQEHFIPVTAGGGYVVENIIPACASCNASKNDSTALDWLTRKFGTRKAKPILERIAEYFEWCKEQS